MPYTPPSQRSPAASNSSSPNISRRSSSYDTGAPVTAPPPSSRPDLPRSTSYLTRHRRTTSVKTTAFAPSPEYSEPTPPGTAESENTASNALSASASLRQSPPPVTDESKIPTGLVLSPPESAQNSSDDEETEESRGRELENLAELQAAIRIIGQHRESSPIRQAADLAHANQALTLVMPDKALDIKVIPGDGEGVLMSGAKKIAHARSNTDSSVYLDLRQPSSEATSLTGSEEEDESGDESDRSHRKPPMLRKKSGELVRPALRPSSRRRPSSMPGTPTFSKAVHFDSHLEHVRHFLQVDRPLAVSAGSSPVESYESETEFPFSDEDSSRGRSPPYEWEISLANFPSDTPDRLRQPVRVERVFLSTDNRNMIGVVAVANLAFNKTVIARFTLDYWKTTSEVVAEFNNDVRRKQVNDGYDRFNFNIKLADQANLEAKTMFFCVKYAVNGQEYWDNNNNTNYQVDFKKKAKPQNGKKGLQGAASRPANGLPRSSKKSPQALQRPRTMPTAFDDFADGFDSSSKFDFSNFKKPVSDLIGEASNPSLRLKGSKSAVSLASDNLTRRAPNANGQAFSNRYDFGASLSAAIQAANNAMGDRSGLMMKPSSSKLQASTRVEQDSSPTRKAKGSPQQTSVPGTSTKGTDSPRPSGTEQPILASQSYNELLDKYCFFGSSKSSPQLKDGTLNSRPAQYDGNDDGYILASESSSPESQGSPQQTETERRLPSSRNASNTTPAARSTSPAPMTGFATGTSPVYPYHVHSGFPFSDAYKATAIRG